MALLAKNKPRSYGTTSVMHHSDMCVEHVVQDGDSLQSLAIKYDVTVDDILHLNRLYATDSIHLRKTLLIPSSKARKAGKQAWQAAQDTRTPEQVHDDTVHAQARDHSTAPATKEIQPDDFLKQFDARFAQAKSNVESSLGHFSDLSSNASDAGSAMFVDPSFLPSSSSFSPSRHSALGSHTGKKSRGKESRSKKKQLSPGTTGIGDDILLEADNDLFEL